MKIIVLLGNIFLICYMGYDQFLNLDNIEWSLTMILVLLALNCYYLVNSRNDWLGLYFQRKSLEEKAKIERIKKEIVSREVAQKQ